MLSQRQCGFFSVVARCSLPLDVLLKLSPSSPDLLLLQSFIVAFLKELEVVADVLETLGARLVEFKHEVDVFFCPVCILHAAQEPEAAFLVR